MMLRLLSTLVVCTCFAGAARAEPRTYAIDPVHTRIVFFAMHAGFSRAIGTFSGTTGTLSYDPDDPSAAQVEASIPIESLELGDDKWRKKVLDPTFFNVGKFPVARFVSTRVDAVEAGHLRVTGTLNLHGEENEVVLDVQINEIKRHPLTLRSTAGFSARAQLSRAAFGMNKWKRLVGDPVEVMIELEATRERQPNDSDAE